MPDVTASVTAPRIAAIEYPLGRNLGQPGDITGQTAVLRATFQALQEIKEPGSVVHLPFEWPETPKEVRSHPQEPPPIAKAISRRPWLYRNLLNGNIPG
jgi:D-proline reductase (dithiol) PrdB